jgi:hypothetical protein
MTPFPDQLKLAPAGMRGSSRLFQLLESFRFIRHPEPITVPAGFVTDGASVPRLFWNILGPFGSYFEPAIVHDYLYSVHNTKYTRPQCDAIFLEAMACANVPWFRRNLIYRCVRLGGGSSFKAFKALL